MERLERLHNKVLSLLILCFLACENSSIDVYDARFLNLKTKKGLTYNNNVLFNGVSLKLNKKGDTLSVEEYLSGKKNGKWKNFYPNGQLRESRFFDKGIKKGDHFFYFPSGQLKFHYQLDNDVYHGFKKAWNPEGKLISYHNFKNGYEEGSQKVWYDNGKIKNNYIIKNGRRYGLLGTKNCINVKDSVF